jgi:hypothetical protein
MIVRSEKNMMRYLPNKECFVAMMLAIACFVTTVAWQEESRCKEFKGWIIRQNGQVQYYPLAEWNSAPGPDSFTLRKSRSNDYVTYFGTFYVVELHQAEPPAPGGESVPFSWTVTQDGVTHVYQDKGWTAKVSSSGISLNKFKIQVSTALTSPPGVGHHVPVHLQFPIRTLWTV